MGIVLMAFADPNKSSDWDAGRQPVEVDVHEKVARHYGAPFISLAREVYERVNAGEFSWKYDFRDLHPSPFGQEIYFNAIKTMIRSAQNTGVEAVLPVALDPFSYVKGRYETVNNATRLRGFTYVENWTPTDGKGTRNGFVNVPALVAEKGGATFELPFEGRAVGIAIVSGPDAGIISYSVDGKKPKKLDLFTQWSNQLHLPWYLLLEDELKPGPHKLRVTLTPRADASAGGNACRIIHFLVSD